MQFYILFQKLSGYLCGLHLTPSCVTSCYTSLHNCCAVFSCYALCFYSSERFGKIKIVLGLFAMSRSPSSSASNCTFACFQLVSFTEQTTTGQNCNIAVVLICTYADGCGQFDSHWGDITWHEQRLQDVLSECQRNDCQRGRPAGQNVDVSVHVKY